MTGSELVRRLLRPVARPVLRRLDARIEVRERAQREALAALANRLEFVRKEILLELRYAKPQMGTEAKPETQLLSPEKLAAMGDHVMVNLGAGHLARPDYLNVDARALEGIDLVAQVGSLPFEPGSLAEIFSAHLLEHFPAEELRRSLLPYWVSLLRPGGSFVAVVPDVETMITEYTAGRMPFEDLREVLYGGQEYEGDFHHNGFSPASLGALLVEAGLVDVETRAVGRRNGLCYEMELAGTRPHSAPA